MPKPVSDKPSKGKSGRSAKRQVATDVAVSDLIAAAEAAGEDLSAVESRTFSHKKSGSKGAKGSSKVVAESGKSKKKLHTADVEAQEDTLSTLAQTNWSVPSKKFNNKLVEQIYNEELKQKHFPTKSRVFLEFSRYLENYLWPHFHADKATDAHVMTIVLMVNEKSRESVPPWTTFEESPTQFPALFAHVRRLAVSDKVSVEEQLFLVIFLTRCFNSFENALIRTELQPLVSLPIWMHLLPGQREEQFKLNPKLRKTWTRSQKNDAALDAATLAVKVEQRSFLRNLIARFIHVLAQFSPDVNVPIPSVHHVRYAERMLEMCIDLINQLATRRYVNQLLHSFHIILRCRQSALVTRPEGSLFGQLLTIFKFYDGFEISDHTGLALSDNEMTRAHYDTVKALQRVCFREFPELKSLALASVGSVDTRPKLLAFLEPLSDARLLDLAKAVHLVGDENAFDDSVNERSFLLELFVERYERRLSQTEAINGMPLYPTEQTLWDPNLPNEFYAGERCLALPKLNMQFLTLHDYLLRNLNLFRMESTYEIRGDIEDAVRRMAPRVSFEGQTQFEGWARMAAPVKTFAMAFVNKPNLGDSLPASVKADITIDLNAIRAHCRAEWQQLRRHDVMFLLTIRATRTTGERVDGSLSFLENTGVVYVRGCEVEGLVDENNKLVEERPYGERPKMHSHAVVVRVKLDPSQYQIDLDAANEGYEDVYETFNLLVRRNAKENNFKAVLETIRNMMNAECIVPEWLREVFLGFGNPESVHYKNMRNQVETINFNDTFLDLDHLKESFPGEKIIVAQDGSSSLDRPFVLQFPKEAAVATKRAADDSVGGAQAPVSEKSIVVSTTTVLNRGPYPFNQARKNTVRFTPTQVEGIRAAMQPGVTLVVGPPGTGKTDVAVQIISNLYHNFPDQRILLVTHSNQALNQLFEKIMALDVDERHLLRLGHGEEELATDKDFGKFGRVNYVLERRLQLLHQVKQLADSLSITGDVAFTCETATYFHLYHIVSRWEKYQADLQVDRNNVQKIAELFPFREFFADAPQPLFHGRSVAEDTDIAEGCYRYVTKLFTELGEYRAFELLRTSYDRTNYLLVKEARIIAMTCTHAALKRDDLVELGFKYDTILMEEAAQILDIETFIPMVIQNAQDGINRLKRIVMIGDHHQLPPVIKNMAFQKYSNMEQSLFTRFVRLGVKTVDLDRQGRARSSIAKLYNWRYKNLADLPHILALPEFSKANAGFAHDFQFVNVDAFQGQGESTPQPYFYQNLAEAEYVVGTYMFMRLLGYPAEKITLLTTYNGQKALLRDIVNARCASDPRIGLPAAIVTVDKYQGSQNDYILLSLVRTSAVGHLRDVRRLVVALSRARLGLYVFGRASLFRNCFELKPAMDILFSRPLELQLVLSEQYHTVTRTHDAAASDVISVKDMVDMCGTIVPNLQATLSAGIGGLQPARIAVSARPTEEDDDDVEEGAELDGDESDQDEDGTGGVVSFPVGVVASNPAATTSPFVAAESSHKRTAETESSQQAQSPPAKRSKVAADAVSEETTRSSKTARGGKNTVVEEAVPVDVVATAATGGEVEVAEETTPTKKAGRGKKAAAASQEPEESAPVEPAAEETTLTKKAGRGKKPVEEPAASQKVELTAPESSLTTEEVDGLKVPELKAELAKRNLDTKGNKKDLAARLKEAL